MAHTTAAGGTSRREPAGGLGDADLDRLGTGTGLIASLAVGVPVLLSQLRGADLLVGPVWLWWAAYLGHLGAFLLIDRPRRTGLRWLSDRWLLAAMVVLGATAFVLASNLGWTGVLLVLTAVTSAFVLSTRATAVLVGAQCALLGAVYTTVSDDPIDGVMAVLVYGAFQAFGVVVVLTQRHERAAREELAAVNLELRAATALLEESSRTAERLRIARELHDVVGHQLTALALELEVASHRSAPPAAEHVERARLTAKDLLADVRTAVGELRAPTPHLRAALQAVVADLPRPQVRLEVDDDLQVDEETTVALIRCVQEIVTNAVRHAQAEHLSIALRRRPDGGVQLEAHDDGRGAARVEPGNGLTGMRERLEALGGALGVSADEGRGFRLVAEVPAP